MTIINFWFAELPAAETEGDEPNVQNTESVDVIEEMFNKVEETGPTSSMCQSPHKPLRLKLHLVLHENEVWKGNFIQFLIHYNYFN